MLKMRSVQGGLLALSVASHASWWLISLAMSASSAVLFPLSRELPSLPEWALASQLAAAMVMQVVGILFWKRFAPFWERKVLVVSAWVVFSFGALLYALAGFGFLDSHALYYVGSALVGLSTPPIYWVWMELVSTMELRAVGISVSLSVLAGGLLLALCVVIAPHVPLAAVAILAGAPASSAVMLGVVWHYLPSAKSVGIATPTADFHMPRVLFGGVFFYSLILGFVVSMSGSLSGVEPAVSGWARMGSEFAATTLLLIGILSFGRDVDLGRLQRSVLPLVVLSFLLMPILAAKPALLAGSVYTGYRYFYMLSLIVYADLTMRMPAPASAVVSWGSLASCSGLVLSAVLYWAFSSVVVLSDSLINAVSLVVTLVAIISSTYFLNERNIQTCWGSAVPQPSVPLDASHHDRSIALAAAHGLTAREQEVMMLLAEGRNANGVATTLVVSIPTARTHIHRIYQKFGVRSQAELMAVLDGRVDPTAAR